VISTRTVAHPCRWLATAGAVARIGKLRKGKGGLRDDIDQPPIAAMTLTLRRTQSNFCCHCVLVIRSVPTLACNRTPSYVLSRRDMRLDMAYNKRVKLRVRIEIGFNHRSC
jgi:hypothetical protein